MTGGCLIPVHRGVRESVHETLYCKYLYGRWLFPFMRSGELQIRPILACEWILRNILFSYIATTWLAIHFR